ncbi:MAG TPA: hypothetical protein VI168_18525, partial [Croceibacterium sp.]
MDPAPEPQPEPPSSELEEQPAPAAAPAPTAGRGLIPLSRDLAIPGEHPAAPALAATPLATIAGSAVFTRERRVRFLDHLAINGSARAAARHARVSHETVYRARRQDPAFAALWDAALVHAREQSASALATRALDGVEVDVWYHGEVVGTRTVHDPRLLLAHVARLDRQVEGNAAALARADRFDELLAGYAGQTAPAGFAEAAGQALDWRERGEGPVLPPTREDYVAGRRSQAAG